MRVLLADAVPSVLLGSAAPWRVVDGAGNAACASGRPAHRARIAPVDGKKLVSPLTFEPGRSPVEAAGLPYRGKLVLDLRR